MEKKVLVVGDVMLDSYHLGEVNRISPEAPIPVFLEKGRKKYAPGGAANVAVNIAAIGVPTDLFSIVGEDEYGCKLTDQLTGWKVNTELVLRDRSYTTTSKLRYIGPGNQQILRVDSEDTRPVGMNRLEQLFKKLESNIAQYGVVVLSDYLKGLLTEQTTRRLIEVSSGAGIPVLVDVKDRNIDKYRGATLLKPNKKELAELTGRKTDSFEAAVEAAVELCKLASCEYVMATLGADGMILVNKNDLIRSVKSVAREVFDVTGAGDTSIAYLAAEVADGASFEEAMVVSNYAAGVQVSKVGTSVVYPDEVFAVMMEEGQNTAGGQLDYYDPDGLAPLERLKSSGKKIVFTNGCFDILHAGHISYLKRAKQLGDVLVVGVNSDASVRRLKGDTRPVNCIEDRMLLLSSLSFVDYVVMFDEDTPADLIHAIRPDVLVKGGDYSIDNIVGADEVQAYGGIVKVLPFVDGKSTTGIIEKMKKG